MALMENLLKGMADMGRMIDAHIVQTFIATLISIRKDLIASIEADHIEKINIRFSQMVETAEEELKGKKTELKARLESLETLKVETLKNYKLEYKSREYYDGRMNKNSGRYQMYVSFVDTPIDTSKAMAQLRGSEFGIPKDNVVFKLKNELEYVGNSTKGVTKITALIDSDLLPMDTLRTQAQQTMMEQLMKGNVPNVSATPNVTIMDGTEEKKK